MKHEKPCPNCGHCPTCGHTPPRLAPTPYVYPYYVQPHWQWIPPTVAPTYPSPIYSSPNICGTSDTISINAGAL